jgi:hypothetical protein
MPGVGRPCPTLGVGQTGEPLRLDDPEYRCVSQQWYSRRRRRNLYQNARMVGVRSRLFTVPSTISLNFSRD